MNDMADGLGFAPRVKEPETNLLPGMAAPAPRKAQDGQLEVGALSMPDTSQPGPVALQSPAAWVYDFDPANGSSRATYNGEVSFTSGGSATAGVTSFNTRTGAVSLQASDLTALNALTNPSPGLLGTPTCPTAAPGTSTTQIASTAFVAAAIVANPIVQSWNGRTGAVTLTASDITSAGGATTISPALTGTPTAPTASQGTASSQIASTQFVANAIASGAVSSFNGRQGAVNLTLSDVQSVGGAPINSPTFTGVPAAPTAAPGTNTTQIASTAFVSAAVAASTSGVASWNGRTGVVTLTATDLTNAGGALLASPALTGVPTAPTATAGTATTQLATTAFVSAAVGAGAGVSTFNGRSGAVTLQLSDVTSVGGAPTASPTFTGVAAAPTPTAGDNSTKLATTAFVATSFLPILGTTTGNNAAAGAIGEFITADNGSAVPLVNNTAKTVVSINLTAGDWDVEGWGNLSWSTSNGTVGIASLSLTPNTIQGGAPFTAYQGFFQLSISAAAGQGMTALNAPTGRMRLSFATTTVVYLCVYATFATGACSAGATLTARRVR